MSATITAFPRAAVTHGILPADGVRPGTVQTSSDEPHAHLRITRRGRSVLTLAVVGAVFALVVGFLLTGGNAVATDTSADVHFEHVTVASGETLWQVAEDVAPTADPRDVIADIVQLNNLDTTQVLAGQSIAIPTKYTEK